MLEVEVMREDGRCAPDRISRDQWERLLQMPSRNQRTNYLLFLWKLEKKKENVKVSPSKITSSNLTICLLLQAFYKVFISFVSHNDVQQQNTSVFYIK